MNWTERLIDLLGLRDEIPAGAQARFEWGNLPKGDQGLFLIVIVLALTALTVWLYRKEGHARRTRKAFLALCRLAFTLFPPPIREIVRVAGGRVERRSRVRSAAIDVSS